MILIKNIIKLGIKIIHYIQQTSGTDRCPLCGKSFVKLQIHIRDVHLKLRPYKCHFCEKTFGQSGNRRVHMKRYHFDDFTARESDAKRDRTNNRKLPNPVILCDVKNFVDVESITDNNVP